MNQLFEAIAHVLQGCTITVRSLTRPPTHNLPMRSNCSQSRAGWLNRRHGNGRLNGTIGNGWLNGRHGNGWLNGRHGHLNVRHAWINKHIVVLPGKVVQQRLVAFTVAADCDHIRVEA